MAGHEWKIGDWCCDNGRRGLVFSVAKKNVSYVMRNGTTDYFITDWPADQDVQHLPDCDSWEWKAIDPGPGYRLIDKSADTPVDGDEYLGASGWLVRARGGVFHPKETYRRKLAPTHRPWSFETMPFAVKVRGKNVKDLLSLAAPIDKSQCSMSELGKRGYEYLFNNFEQLDGSPCGEEV